MKRIIRLCTLGCLAMTALAPTALGADRMWVGFHDDPVLRFDAGRQAQMDVAKASNATVLRTLVTWSDVAPTRPANAANPFDPVYKLDDLDEFVRNAQVRDMEVLITLWGTPKWANGGKTPNYLPKSMADFGNFARAIASRYSGRYPGYPFVRFYAIWNESNLASFLSPQFNSRGTIVGPAAYARLAAAGYAGIKAGSRQALVAIGETSSTGRDRKKSRATDSVAPGTFARLVAKANPRLKFDAWGQHPYPFPVNMKPTQKVKWPNVALTSLKRFEASLDQWFRRKNIPVWVTEYGQETKPGEPKGVTEAQQRAYVPQAFRIVNNDPRIQMFIWFVLRDSSGSPWQSGLLRANGAAKPARGSFNVSTRPLNMVNRKLRLRAGTKNPALTVNLRQFCANNQVGAPVGVEAKAMLAGKVAGFVQAQSPLALDCTATFRLDGLTVAKGMTYTVQLDLNTKNGNTATRTFTIVAV